MKNYNRNMFSARLLMSMVIAFMTYGAWAVVKPVAVWNRDFPSTGNSATRGVITLDLNGNNSNGAAITITSSANGGVRLMNSSHPYGEVTALVAIKTNDVNFASQPVFGTGRRWVSNTDTRNNDCGTYITSTGYQHGFHSNSTDWKTAADVAWPSGIGLNYAAFHYQTQKDYGSRGTYAYYTTPTGYSTSYDNKNNLVNGDAATLYGVTIGGCYNKTDTTLSIGQMAGAEIQFIALFASTYADQSTYASPSELQKWSLPDMTSALTPVSGDTLSAANNATLVHQGVNLPTGGYITIDGDVTVAALFAQGNSEIRFADSDSSLTVNGVVYVAGSNTLTINASAFNDLPGESESSVTYDALLCSNIAGTIAITEPTVADGYLVEKVVDTTGYHVVIAKGAHYDETITGSKNWSSEKPEDWLDGSAPTIDITVANGTTAEFTFDEAVQAGIATIHCDGNLTLTMGANVTFSSLVIEGSGNVTLAKSGSPTISIGAYDFSDCTGVVTLGYVISPSIVTGDVTLGSAYGSEATFPAFTGNVTVGTSMSSVSSGFTDVAASVSIPSGSSLSVSGAITLGSGYSHNYSVDGGQVSLTGWTIMGDNTASALTIKNGGTMAVSGTFKANHYITSVVPTYTITGTGSKLSIGTLTASMWGSGSLRQGFAVSDGGTIEFGTQITSNNTGIPTGYDINLTNAKIGSCGAWSTESATRLTLATGVKINLSGANTFDTSTYNVTYNHQIADQNAGTPGSITKTGSGTLTLSAASPAKGTFTVSAGELAFTTGSWAGSVDVTAGTLTVPGTSAVIAGNVTVRSGAILSITTESPFMNVCSGTLTLESGAVVKVNGTTVASPVVVDGSIASSTSCVWGAGTTGEWDTNANWLTGAAPSAENAVVLRTANATITVSANSTAGAVCVDESTTIAGTAAALASFATKVTSITVASGKTLTLSCTDSGTYTFSKAIVGAGSFAVSGGTVTLSGASTFLGNMIVCANTKAIAGASGYAGDGGSGPFGPKVTAASVASATRRVEVLSGGTIDMNGKDEMRYFFKLAGNGDGNGALINTGSEVGTGKANVSGIELSGDASIGGSGNFGIIAGGYNTTVFDLAGHTLSKKGNNTVWVINGSKKADSTKGTLKVEAGVLSVYDGGPSYNRTTDLSDTAVQVAGGTLTVNGAFNIGALTQNGGTITVNEDKTLTVSSINVAASATMSPSGTIACNGDMTIGGTVTVPAGKIWTVSETLTVKTDAEVTINGTLRLPKNAKSDFIIATVEEDGTIYIGNNGFLDAGGVDGYSRFNMYGDLVVDGGKFESIGDMEIFSSGTVTVNGIGSLFLHNKIVWNRPGNSGIVTLAKAANLISRVYTSGATVTYTPTIVKNTATGKVVFKPTDADISTDSIGAFSDYVVVGDGSVEIDVTNLTLPTGTEKLTLFSTTTALDLTKFSVTGNSDYYLQQNAQDAETNPGAVTLQLHAAKASTGKYYDTLQDMFMDMNLYQMVLTILDGEGATYATTLAGYDPVYDDTTKELFLAAAQIGETKYPSLSAAFAAATDGQTVTLLKVSSEAGVALNDKSITFSENGKAFSGKLTGNGTIIVSAAPSSTTWTSARFAEGWTGEFVCGWTHSSGDFVAKNYGTANSTVTLTYMTAGQFSYDGQDTGNYGGTLKIAGSVTTSNGYGNKTTWNWQNMTTFNKLILAEGGALNLVWNTGSEGVGFQVNTLYPRGGTITLANNGKTHLKIGSVNLTAEPALDTRIVQITPQGSHVYNSEPLENGLIGVTVTANDVTTESSKKLYFDTDGLYVAAASAVVGGNTKYFKTAAAAATGADADGTITVLVNTDSVTVNPGQSVVVADGVTVGTISWGDEYETVTSVTGDGTTSYTHGGNVATTYYWTGTTDSAWSTVGNWAVGAADGPTATREVTSIDSVVFNNGASLTRSDNMDIVNLTVNGAVTFKATDRYELRFSGSVSGSGTLTLDNDCLKNISGAEKAIPLSINFINGARLAGPNGNAMTITGNVSVRDKFEVWGTTHIVQGNLTVANGSTIQTGASGNSGALTVTGATTLNGSFTKTSQNTLTLGNVVVSASTTPTIESGTIAINGAVTVSNGATFTIPASGLTVGDSASFVLGGKSSVLVDNGSGASGKVSTSMTDGARVVSTTAAGVTTYKVGYGTIFSVY